jgi:formate dehydrogenase (coenzyme F420) beta subunit
MSKNTILMVENIRSEARKALREKKAELIVAFGEGTLPYKTRSIIIDNEGVADQITWNSFCNANLARYLLRFSGQKTGIVAKGCDTRAIVNLINERKLNRSNLYIIGVPCDGMIGISEVERLGNPASIDSIEETDGKLLVRADGKSSELNRGDYLSDSCRDCLYPNPVIYDCLVAEAKQPTGNRFQKVADFEKLSNQERIAFFLAEFDKCIRCYACREVCPFCYCKECFTDSSNPKWIDRGVESTDKTMYLLIRAFHMVGRCVDCGACHRVCPTGVNLNLLMNKIASDLKGNFQFEAGVNPEAKEPLLTFKEEDLNDFIL